MEDRQHAGRLSAHGRRQRKRKSRLCREDPADAGHVADLGATLPQRRESQTTRHGGPCGRAGNYLRSPLLVLQRLHDSLGFHAEGSEVPGAQQLHRALADAARGDFIRRLRPVEHQDGHRWFRLERRRRITAVVGGYRHPRPALPGDHHVFQRLQECEQPGRRAAGHERDAQEHRRAVVHRMQQPQQRCLRRKSQGRHVDDRPKRLCRHGAQENLVCRRESAEARAQERCLHIRHVGDA